jgi:hypothetical protein
MSSSINLLDATDLYNSHQDIITKEWPLVEQGLYFYLNKLLIQHQDAFSLSPPDLIKRKQQLFGSILIPEALRLWSENESGHADLEFLYLLFREGFKRALVNARVNSSSLSKGKDKEVPANLQSHDLSTIEHQSELHRDDMEVESSS